MSGLFVRRPVATTLLSIGLLLIGLVCLSRFGISAMPSVDAPVIRVSGSLPGADARTVATTLTSPLERRIGQIPGIRNLTSNSRAGSTNITIEFAFGRDTDSAARDVQAAINAAGGELPAEMRRAPSYRKANPSAMPVMVLAMTSDSLPASEVYEYAETIVVPRLSQVAGVGEVSVSGSERRAIRIEVDPSVLAALDLSFAEIRDSLAGANSIRPRGEVHGERLAYEFSIDSQLLAVEDYENVIIANRGQKPVRLGDVSRIREAAASQRVAARFNGRPAVLITIRSLPDANVVDTSDAVTAALGPLREWLPESVRLDVQMERTTNIRATIEHVGVILSLSIALAVAVVALFLRRLWATAIPGLAIPVALAGTLAIMFLLDFTLNTISLMALTVAIGFIVDDAIVVIDAIAHRRELGEGPIEAAINGSRQVGFTIVSMSVALTAAFIPLLFMDDFIGRMLEEFSVTVVAAIAVSGVVALTLTPTLCGLLMARDRTEERGGWLLALYGRLLAVALRHRFLSLLATLACIGLIVVVNAWVPKGFFPRMGSGMVSCFVEGPQDISFKSLNERVREVEKVLLTDPAIVSVSSSVSTGRSGSINIILKPEEEQTDTPDQVAARLRPKLARIEGVTVYLIVEQEARGSSRPDRAEYQYTLTTDDLDDLTSATSEVVERFKQLPQLTDVGSDLEFRSVEARLVVDREAATRLGLTMRSIDDALNDAFGEREVSTIITNRDQYPVILEATTDLARSPERLRDVYVRRGSDDQIPLSTVARLEFAAAPISINHRAGFVSSTVSFNVAPGYALGDATKAINLAMAELILPESIRGALRGDAETFSRQQSDQLKLIAIAIVSIYIVLGVLYESAIHPITIISTLPPATLGALSALAATNTQLSVVAMVGIILVVGIVMKNAIILVDYAQEARRHRGLDPLAAIHEAALLRFRPILMTTLTAFVGAMVLAIDHGAGSELRRPLGVAMAGGLAFAQLVTMFSAPVIYVWLSGGWLRRPTWMPRLRWRKVRPASEQYTSPPVNPSGP